MPRRLVPALLLCIAVVAAATAVVASRPADPAPPPTGLRVTTPVLSVRRVPGLVHRLVADSRLQAALDQLLDGRGKSCLVVEEGERVVYERRPDESLIPASTMKVLTALVALRKLGSDAVFRTEARAEGAVADGVLDGRLWFVGAGDPLLSTGDYAASLRNQPQVFTPLEALADAIAQAGVREIRGGIAGDESRYDTQRYVPTWSPSYASEGAIGPVSALAVNDGFQGFAGVGARRVAAPFPASHAAAVLTSLLRARGVVVGGQPGEGVAPESATQVVGSVESPPLREVVAEMLRESDNMTAELLTKELGKRFGGSGTWAAGVGVVRSTVGEIGLPTSGFAAADGSGLDRGDRISCSMLMAAIDLEKAALVPAFAVAGETGTLSRRFLGNPAAGRLKAKTGTLNFVSGLVGVVEPSSGALLEFALLANELPDRIRSGEVLQERIGAALARYPEAPPIEELGPR